MEKQRNSGISKRIFSIFLLLTLLAGIMPFTAFEAKAASSGYYTVTLRRASGTFNQAAASSRTIVKNGVTYTVTASNTETGANTKYTIPDGVTIAEAIPREELLIKYGARAFGGWVWTNSSGTVKEWLIEDETPWDIYHPNIQSYSTGDGSDFYFTATWGSSAYTLTFNPGSNGTMLAPYNSDGYKAKDGQGKNGYEYFNILIQDYEVGQIPKATRSGFTFKFWTYQYLFDLRKVILGATADRLFQSVMH